MDQQKNIRTVLCVCLFISAIQAWPRRLNKETSPQHQCNQSDIVMELEKVRESLQKGFQYARKARCALGNAIDSKQNVKDKGKKSECNHDNRCQIRMDHFLIAKRDSVSIFRFTIPVMESFKESLKNAMEHENTVTEKIQIPDLEFKMLKTQTIDIFTSMEHAKIKINACEQTDALPNEVIGDNVVNHFPETLSHKHYCTADKEEQLFTFLKQMTIAFSRMQSHILSLKYSYSR